MSASKQKRKRTQEPEGFRSPNPAEMDILGILWEEFYEGQKQPLKLSEVHARVGKRREAHGDPAPALTTVSTHLRSLVAKGLCQDVLINPSGSIPQKDSRGFLTPSTRSPLTGYIALHPPGAVLAKTMRGIAVAYPRCQHRSALVDFARVLELPPEIVENIKRLLKLEHTAHDPLGE